LQRLEHPNIIWLLEIIDDPLKDDYIYLVTEYHSRGSLGDLIKKLNTKCNEHY
jgi:serine/threonine protein kinase